ncbi:1-deoxy-D-xylulose-5-phosphate synthase [Natronospira bacteriovora]|uniref:1-deoxy-D-xylulose-5-phosphate synthase n=1 Tax=Natronospira bacteriovora TaxID=3069753 RepID=A0ABU0W3F1_9GAMM|nr:1-deoxy-D-xylulose-5-phosphate synthase [Natronospira sp. AB-CW4]MDQ2068538.1 1-deoxy-D-xylulose-5-phosphate synthase [Natronospira sp. AB-CW4]
MPQNAPQFPLLSRIDCPADLRGLARAELPQVARELREFMIQTLSESGGHFAAGLGTVELTLALHYVYQTPVDRIVWDVGHQAYPHKILTGRREQLATIRKAGGLAPFPKREESEYDTFGVGHSSTSVSAALGMALANRRLGGDRRVAAVIGDGAMTAGMAFEALNHAGSTKADMLVILNDNDMSISENVGALSNYFSRVLSSRLYGGFREGSKKALEMVPPLRELVRKSEEHFKGMVAPATLFEELGLNYVGPVDGHDVDTLVETLANLRERPGPQFLHIVTRKGKGYGPAELDPITWHGPGKFDPAAGKLAPKKPAGPSYSQVFGQWACDLAAQDERLVCITPAMREGSGLVEFHKRFPDRYYDVGIAEQHSVTVAAGLACEGIKPVVAIYSTFLQRAYDQAIHDVAVQNLPVLFAIDRAGPVGGDGATHAGSFDISFLRCLPNMAVLAPSDENECRQMLYTSYQHEGPAAVRYPRGQGPGVNIEQEMQALPWGKAREVRQRKAQGGKKGIAILSFGALLDRAREAAEELDAALWDMRFVKPLDLDTVEAVAARHEGIVTIEDNTVLGGAGSGVLEALSEMNITIPTLVIGLPDQYLGHGSRDDVLEEAGLTSEAIKARIERWWNEQDKTGSGKRLVS